MANKMTTCKVCGAEVAKSASTCPKCGAKLKKKHPILGILIVLIAIGVIVSVVGGNNQPKKVGTNDTPSSSTTTTKTTEPTQAPAQSRFEVGDKVELNDIVVSLVSVSESNGSSYNKPSEGNVFILCEFEIENNSSKEIAISSMMSFSAYCDDYATNLSLGALMEKGNKNQLDGTVASGKKFNGVVGYEVPADWKEIELQFTPDFWTGKDIKFVATH